jgi:hypothetical protein
MKRTNYCIGQRTRTGNPFDRSSGSDRKSTSRDWTRIKSYDLRLTKKKRLVANNRKGHTAFRTILSGMSANKENRRSTNGYTSS